MKNNSTRRAFIKAEILLGGSIAGIGLARASLAIVSTKIPILLSHGYGRFALPNLPQYGFLSMMHEARTDFSMWFGLLFLLIVGARKLSFDAILARGR